MGADRRNADQDAILLHGVEADDLISGVAGYLKRPSAGAAERPLLRLAGRQRRSGRRGLMDHGAGNADAIHVPRPN